MTDTSSTDPLAANGAYPKTAEEFNKRVKEEVDKAVRSLVIADQSRPQVARQPVASEKSGVWTWIGAVFTVVSVQLGSIYWLNDSIRTDLNAEIGSLRAEIGSLRVEIGSLRADLNAEIGSLRADLNAEIGSLRADLNAEIGSLRAELRAEISELRSDMREDFASVRAEISEVWVELRALNERMSRVETLVEDKPSSGP